MKIKSVSVVLDMQKVLDSVRVVCVLVVFVTQSIFGASPEIFAREVKDLQRWALLVGIGEYANLPSLQGPMNDVEILAYVLQTRYGFKNDHILTLRNEAATRDRIVQEFEGLIAKATPSDIVYVHYSGHGSQVKDLNGDELDDQKDETIVPYDGRTQNIPDITDDELHALLNQILAKRVIVSIDACHSGSVTRGVDIRTRAIPPDTRLELYRHSQRYTRGSRVIGTLRSVVFTSSAPHEQALDGRIAGRYHGYFSYAVFRSLFTAARGANSQTIFEGIKRELYDIKNLLHRRTFPAPQLEVSERLKNEPLLPIQGDGRPHEIETDQGLAAGARVFVKPIEGGMVELEPARYLGGLPTSVWEIILANVPPATQSNEKILATVTAMKGMNAVAKVSNGERLNFKHAYARLVQPAQAPSRLSMLLREFHESLTNQGRKIQQMLQPLREASQLGVVGNYIVDVSERAVEIRSADGLETVKKLPAFDAMWIPEKLDEFLEHSLRTVKLRQLRNPTSSIILKARLLNTLEDNGRAHALLSDPVLYIRQPHEPASGRNSLQLEVWVNTPSFLTIFDVDAEGAIRLLFPSPFQKHSFYPKGLIPAKEKVVLPDSFERSNQSGFVWDIDDPSGKDTLVIFASSDERTAKNIRQLVLDIPQDHDRPVRGDSSIACTSYEQLRNMLYSNMRPIDHIQACGLSLSQRFHAGQSRERGEGGVHFETTSPKVNSDWNAMSLNFWIEELR